MATNSFFSHDSNARNSDKIIPLRMKLGVEGYGLYFMILERLREEPEYMSVKDYNMIAFDFRVSSEKVKSVIEDFGLFVFTEDGKHFYSEGFNARMAIKDEKSSRARESASVKWGKESNAKIRSQRLSEARSKGTHIKDEWNDMKSFFGCCVRCGELEGNVEIVKDHITPMYQGGSDGIDNIQPLCRKCNASKGPENTDYRLSYCQRISKKMPAKWVRNGCETPAIKGKESKVKDKSSIISLSVEDDEISLRRIDKEDSSCECTTATGEQCRRKAIWLIGDMRYCNQHAKDVIGDLVDIANAKCLTPPSLSEMEDYFTSKGFSKELAKRAYDYYTVGDWKDRNGNQVKNWKQKCVANWLKPENKINIQLPYDGTQTVF